MANVQLWPCIKLLTNKAYSGRLGVCISNDQPALAGESRSLPWTMSLSCLEPSSDSRIPIGSSPSTWPLGPLKLAGHSRFSPCAVQPHTPHCSSAKPPTVSPTSHDYSLLSAFARSVPSSATPFPLYQHLLPWYLLPSLQDSSPRRSLPPRAPLLQG